MKRLSVMLILAMAAALTCAVSVPATEEYADCLDCHTEETPKIVDDWLNSAHHQGGANCVTCHGPDHTSADDVDEVRVALPDTCAECHPERVEQFKAGKHAKAWVAMNAMPTIHWQPQVVVEGMEGCGSCHRLGLKTEEQIKRLKAEGADFGLASCDACHTRHLFSAKEAAQPQSCRTCHMGIDHPQWEMYSSSKHGVRFSLKQMGILPEDAAAPTCQRCHMTGGDHAVGTAWGFLAVRLPMPENEEWASDRATILKGLGVLSPDGEPTARLEAVKAADVARLTQEAWQTKRNEMIDVCSDCHSTNFARHELQKGDKMIQAADGLMAEGIQIVAGLYQDGVLERPESYAHDYPDLLTFHDAPTVIEQRLFLMFLKHRMRTFQGSFHQNPDYALWYGWAEMNMDLTAIESMAADMRKANQDK